MDKIKLYDQYKATVYNIGVITILLAIGLQSYLFFLLLYPVKIYETKINPIPVLQKQVHAGDPVLLRIDYCKYEDIPEHIIGQITGSNNISIALGESQEALPVGCHSVISKIWTIPSDTPPEKYKLQFIVEHQINVFRFDEQYQQTEVFEVLGTPVVK